MSPQEERTDHARRTTGMISKQDRDLIRTWAEHGIPQDESTLIHVEKLMGKLAHEVDMLHSIIDQLVATDTEGTK